MEAHAFFEIKINIDLDVASAEKKIYIYVAHFYPIWIKHSGVMLSHGSLLPTG